MPLNLSLDVSLRINYYINMEAKRKPGRPAIMEGGVRHVSIVLPTETAEACARFAASEGMSFSAAVRRILTLGLTSIPRGKVRKR